MQLFVQMTLRYAKRQNVMSGFFGFNSLVIARLRLDCSQHTTSSLQLLQSCVIKTFSKSCSDFTKTIFIVFVSSAVGKLLLLFSSEAGEEGLRWQPGDGEFVCDAQFSTPSAHIWNN